MAENISDTFSESQLERDFNLLDESQSGSEITVRDDQYDFAWLLDAAGTCRRSGSRFRCVDSGYLPPEQMQWLAQAGADIYTSDAAGRSAHDLIFINKACNKGRSFTAFFLTGLLGEKGDSSEVSLPQLSAMGDSGIVLHISNREYERNLSDLSSLASSCAQGSGRLVYYHHGLLIEDCIRLADNGSWVHVSDRSLKSDEQIPLMINLIKSARSSGAGVVLFVEEKTNVNRLWEVFNAGGFILFKNGHFDYKSPYRPIQEKGRHHILDFKAVYLNTTVFP